MTLRSYDNKMILIKAKMKNNLYTQHQSS